MNFSDPVFRTSLFEVIGINIILSGDNAVVIALTARSLPPKQQKMAIFFGSAAAVLAGKSLSWRKAVATDGESSTQQRV